MQKCLFVCIMLGALCALTGLAHTDQSTQEKPKDFTTLQIYTGTTPEEKALNALMKEALKANESRDNARALKILLTGVNNLALNDPKRKYEFLKFVVLLCYDQSDTKNGLTFGEQLLDLAYK